MPNLRNRTKTTTDIICRKVESERALFLSDVHVPFHDPETVELILEFARWFQPHTVFIVGDFLDCYAVSRFDKDPQRLLSLQDELDVGFAQLGRIRAACPSAVIEFMEGNHEHRLSKYLWQHPEISVLDNLKLPALLHLDELGIGHHDYHQQIRWHGLLVEHGNLARKHSAATAKGMLESRGVSGLSGHTHRLATYYVTDNSGVKVWYENGCACLLNPTYIIGQPNWCQGFSVGFSEAGKKRFAVHQIPIIDHVLVYQDHYWRA